MSNRRDPFFRNYPLLSLLVLLGVSAVVIGLMVAVLGQLHIREAEARCRNNLQQLLVAVHNYASTHANQLVPLSGVPITKGLAAPQSILFALLPYLDEKVPYKTGLLYDPAIIYESGMRGSSGQTWNGSLPDGSGPIFSAGLVKTFVCPADSSNSTTEPTANGWVGCSYAANFMVFANKTTAVVDPRSGAIYREMASVYNIGNIPDGNSNTIFFAERFAMAGSGTTAVPNAWADPPANDALCSGNPLCGPIFAYTAPYGNPVQDPLGQQAIGQRLPFQGPFGATNYVYPGPEIDREPPFATPGSAQSQHWTVVQVAMGDGSARGISTAVSHQTWLKAISPNDRVGGQEW
jgi:hypothetical protein